MKYDGVSASKVICRYLSGEVSFYVPSALLEPETIAGLLLALRARYLPGPGDSHFDPREWDTFRVVSIVDAGGYLMPGLGDGGQSPPDPLDKPGAAV